MGTHITYRQVTVDLDHDAIEIPHAEGGTIQVLSADFAGGGNPEHGRFVLHVIVLEPTLKRKKDGQGNN